MGATHDGWAGYLQEFHDGDKAGITERMLSRARLGETEPFGWCAELLPADVSPVVDLACGSGPMAAQTNGWIGIDVSIGELGVADAERRGPLVLASATAVPLRSGGAGAVVCSMSMQVIEPLDAMLDEVRRLLVPGGVAALMVPTGGPVGWRDAITYAQLMVALRRTIGYPNHPALSERRLAEAAQAHGLRVTHDERRAFALPIRSGADGAELVESLYLPGIDPKRLVAAKAVLGPRIGRSLEIPLRRIALVAT